MTKSSSFKEYQLADMTGGWFIGDFEPSILRSAEFEVAIKKYNKGDYEKEHYHKRATEITVMVAGEAEVSGCLIREGQIMVIKPNTPVDFKALTDVTTCVVKTPSVRDDKFIGKLV